MTDQELMEEKARMSDGKVRRVNITTHYGMVHGYLKGDWVGDPTGAHFLVPVDEIERLREERDKLAEYVRLLWAKQCYEWGPEFQEIGNALEICELRPVEPGSPEEEEWGEEAELYYLAPWVIGGEDV